MGKFVRAFQVTEIENQALEKLGIERSAQIKCNDCATGNALKKLARICDKCYCKGNPVFKDVCNTCNVTESVDDLNTYICKPCLDGVNKRTLAE